MNGGGSKKIIAHLFLKCHFSCLKNSVKDLFTSVMIDQCQADFLILNRPGEENKNNLVGQGRNRDIVYQLLSRANQFQFGEEQFNLLPIKIDLDGEKQTQNPNHRPPNHSPHFPQSQLPFNYRALFFASAPSRREDALSP